MMPKGMLGLTLKSAAGLIGASGIIVLGSIIFAAFTSPHHLLADFCDIAAPCWRGIVPDVTTLDEATQLLEGWGYEWAGSVYGVATTYQNRAAIDWCYVTLGVFEGRLTSITLQQCAHVPEPLRVGDIAGEPLTLFYTGEINYDYARITLSADGLSPYSRLNTITLTIDGGTVYSPCQVPWMGFALTWVYQRQARVQC